MRQKRTKHKEDNQPNNAKKEDNVKRLRNRHLSKNYINTRNFLSLLEKKRSEDLKLWQNLEPHYTDLLNEQLKTQRKMNYLQSLANFGHNNVRKVFLFCLPINIIVFSLLCLITPAALNEFYTGRPNFFRALIWAPLSLAVTNIPLFFKLRRNWHDHTYSQIKDRLGLQIFKYFEVVEKDKHTDGGYTKREITNILRRFNPNLPYTQEEIANYLQGILEIEMERKPRGLVYYIFLKEKYFDNLERKRQTDTLNPPA